MYGKTHIMVGAAVSLAVLQPNTVTGVISAVVGGALGGWICDIDLARGKHHDIPWLLLTIALPLIIDYRIGGGLCDYIVGHWNLSAMIGAGLLLIVCICELLRNQHKTFAHSILGLAVFNFAIFLVCKPIIYSFAIGTVTHLCLDMLTPHKMMLFYPFRMKVSLGLCKTNGMINNALWIIGMVALVFMLVCFWRTGNVFPL